MLIALFFVYQPERTIGAGQPVDEHALAGVPLRRQPRHRSTTRSRPSARSPTTCSTTLVYQPWVVLEFGGLATASTPTASTTTASRGPVSPHDPARDVCRDHLQAGRDGHGGYAPRFLRQPPGSTNARPSTTRCAKAQRADRSRRQFAGYQVDKADAPAVDIQQAGGAFQRLTLAVVFFVGALGAVALLGFLSLAVILAQVVALVLLGFAPVALVIGIFPGAGHDFFRGWLAKLATAVFIKALYSLVIAIVVAVSAALHGRDRVARVPVRLRAADDLLLGDLPLPQADHRPARRRHHRRRARRGGCRARPSSSAARDVATAPVHRARRASAAAARARRRARSRRARSPASPRARRRATAPPARSRLDHHDRAPPSNGSRPAGTAAQRPAGHAHAAAPPRRRARADRRRSAARRRTGSRPQPAPARIGQRVERARRDDRAVEHEPTPRASHEDAMRRARELRERQRETADDEADRS